MPELLAMQQSRRAMAGLTCPYCHTFSHFSTQHTWTAPIPNVGDVAFGVWRCDSCQGPIVGTLDTAGDPSGYHPKDIPDPSIPDTPNGIAGDAREAFRCFAIEAWRASAAMARRAIQATAYEKKAPEGRLIDQIDWLAENDHITDQMKKVAHKIRLGGNLGAHPDADGLKDVGKNEAAAVLEFLSDFLKYIYEIPARLDRLGTTGEEGE